MGDVERYYCGNGEGMFDDEKGVWVEYKDYKILLDKYKEALNIPPVIDLSLIEIQKIIERHKANGITDLKNCYNKYLYIDVTESSKSIRDKLDDIL